MPQLEQIRIGHSPDSDDAFMFYALANGLIPTDGFEVIQVAEDIESLNRRAVNGELEVTAISVHAYAYPSLYPESLCSRKLLPVKKSRYPGR